MGYFDDEHNVDEYVAMAQGFDGRELIDVLRKYLADGASVLELGIGPGKDLEILSRYYQVTGSDNSHVFLARYRKRNPAADLVWLDAVAMDLDRRFDGVYSNKVLHHLTRAELAMSLRRQARVLQPDGVLLHSLWHGDGEEEFSGLRFVYYTEESFALVVGDEYEILEATRYTEAEPDDSIFFVLRKTK